MLVEINHGKLIVKKMILHVKNGYGLSRNGQMLQMVAIWVGKTMIDHEWVFALSYFQKNSNRRKFRSQTSDNMDR